MDGTTRKYTLRRNVRRFGKYASDSTTDLLVDATEEQVISLLQEMEVDVDAHSALLMPSGGSIREALAALKIHTDKEHYCIHAFETSVDMLLIRRTE